MTSATGQHSNISVKRAPLKPSRTQGCCKRIRLLVRLGSEETATQLLRAAPSLRESTDDYIAENVFFNPVYHARRHGWHTNADNDVSGWRDEFMDPADHMVKLQMEVCQRQIQQHKGETLTPWRWHQQRIPLAIYKLQAILVLCAQLALALLWLVVQQSKNTCRQLLAKRSLFVTDDLRRVNCCLLNARSIVNKLPDLHSLMYNDQFDVILVTETWLHSEISFGMIDPDNCYHVLRKDRADKHGCVCVC